MFRNCLVAILMLVFLQGCAVQDTIEKTIENSPLGQSTEKEQSRLQSEHNSARRTLLEAKNLGVHKARPEEYKDAEKRIEKIQEQHKKKPADSLIKEYRNIQAQLNRITIDTLSERLRDREEKLDKELKRVSSLKGTLKEKRKTIEKQDERMKSLEERRRSLEARITRLQSKLDNLSDWRDTAARYKRSLQQSNRQTRELEERIEKVIRKNEQLHSKIGEVRSQLRSVQSRRTALGDTLQKVRGTLETVRDTVVRLRERGQKRRDQSQKVWKVNQYIAQEIRNNLKSGTVKSDSERVGVYFHQADLFDTDEAQLKGDARDTIRNMVEVFQVFEERSILIMGHTDKLPIRETIKDRIPLQWKLSAQRAINILKYMVLGLGVPSERISAIGYGHRSPIVSPSSQGIKRGIEIVLLPKSSN